MSKEFPRELGWEDSYQKRERLSNEFSLTLKDLNHFMEVWETESVNMEDQFREEVMVLIKEVELLNKQEDDLGKEIKELEVLYKTEKDEDKKDELMMEISSKHVTRLDLWAKIMEIDARIDEGFKNHLAMNGDAEGTAAIVESKLAHLKELRKEIDELE